MKRCNVSHLPSEIGRLISLTELILKKSNLRTLPDSIRNLTNLASLVLDKCAMLQSLPELPASLIAVNASDCASLEYIELKSLSAWTFMHFIGCHKLAENNFGDKVIEAMIQQRKDIYAPESSDYSPLDQDFYAPESSDYSLSDQDDQDFHALESSYYTIHLSGSEVPRLSEYQSTGSYLSFKVPPTPLIVEGLFICLVFITAKEKVRNRYFKCTSTIHINKVKISESGCIIWGDDQMWLKFVPTNQLKGGDEVEISLAADDSIQFIKCGCGANIIYEVDDENISTEKTNDEELTRHHLTPTLILEEEDEDEEGEEFFDPTN